MCVGFFWLWLWFCILSHSQPTWWRHQMETFSALLALCAGNSTVTGQFHAQRPVTPSFDVFFDLSLNKRLNKQSSGWWFETLSRSLWRHCSEEASYPILQRRHMSTRTSQITWNPEVHGAPDPLCPPTSPATRLYGPQLVQANIKGNSKAPHYWHCWKSFHVMMSSGTVWFFKTYHEQRGPAVSRSISRK